MRYSSKQLGYLFKNLKAGWIQYRNDGTEYYQDNLLDYTPKQEATQNTNGKWCIHPVPGFVAKSHISVFKV